MDILDAQVHSPTSTVVTRRDCPPEEARRTVTQAEASPDIAVIEASADAAVAAMDAVGVRSALIQMWRHEVQVFLERYPDRFAGVPFAYMAGPNFPAGAVIAPDELVELAEVPGMVGVRLVAFAGPDTAPVDEHGRALAEGAYDAWFAEAGRLGLAVFVNAPRLAPALHTTLRAHPDTTIVLDHLGLQTYNAGAPRTPQSPDPFGPLDDVLALARYPNLAVKLTGAPSLSLEPYPFADVWPAVHRLLDAFGPERLMWGSDFTRCAGLHDYREAVDFLALTDEVGDAEKEQLFSGTIRSWLDLPPGL